MYDATTYFAWFVLALLFFVVVGLIVWLGSMPAKIAAKRNHPQVDAINACSWWGLAAGGIGWIVAFVWAFWETASSERTHTPTENGGDSHADLLKRIEGLETQLAAALPKNKTS